MTILDRFRAQPRQRSPDPLVRLGFVRELPIDERVVLGEIAREDDDPRVRKAAVAKLMDPAALSSIAGSDADPGVREAAVWMLRDIALDAFEGIAETDSQAAVDVLSDVKTLAAVAKSALREEVAFRALGRISDVRALGSIARHAQIEPVRLAALAALDDHNEILNVAINSEFKDTAIAAVERLTDRDELDDVMQRAKNKSGAKRARVLLREMDDRLAADAAAAREAELEVTRREQEEQARLQTEQEAAQNAERALREAAERAEQDAAREETEREAEAVRQREEAEHLATAEAERLAAEQRAAEEAAREQQRAAERAAAEERDARFRRENLGRLQQLALRVESLAGKTDLTLRAGDRALRDLRAALGEIPPLPSRKDYEELVARLNAAQTALAPKVHELREAADWQRFANAGVQEQLCQKMEALAGVDDPEAVVRQVKDLQRQWREVSDVPREQGEALWRRFKAAHDQAWARCEAFFAAQAEARAENFAKKLALCEKAEALADSTDWIRTAEVIKALQAEWKAVGPVSRGQERATWERFRAACDRFFTRRQTDLAERKKVWSANLAKKEALCVRAEALAESTEWDAASGEIKRLQAEWKTIGPVKRTRSEAIWQRFRAACDRFFARYAQRHDLARAERVAAREAICAELEGLAPVVASDANAPTTDAPGGPSDPPADLLSRVRTLRARWQQEIAARGVDREQASALDQRFRAAFGRLVAAWPKIFAGSDLDFDANRRQLESLVRRVEELANSLGGRSTADLALSSTATLATMLKEALAANTIGGKVDEESRLRTGAEEVRQAQAAWARVGPVPDEARRALTDRFQRACRRIAERLGEAGRPLRSSDHAKPGGSGKAGAGR